MSYNFTFIYFHCIAPIHEREYLLNNKVAPCAWSLCVPFFCADRLSSRFKWIAFGRDTGQTLTKLKVGSTKKEIRLIMNKFPSHPRGRDILFTTHFFGSLYPVNEISNTCEGAAFKLLFSLEAWRWGKKGGIPPNDRRAITGPVPFGEQSGAGKCNKRLPPLGLFEALWFLISKVCCEKERRRRLRGGRRGAGVNGLLLFSITWSQDFSVVHLIYTEQKWYHTFID